MDFNDYEYRGVEVSKIAWMCEKARYIMLNGVGKGKYFID